MNKKKLLNTSPLDKQKITIQWVPTYKLLGKLTDTWRFSDEFFLVKLQRCNLTDFLKKELEQAPRMLFSIIASLFSLRLFVGVFFLFHCQDHRFDLLICQVLVYSVLRSTKIKVNLITKFQQIVFAATRRIRKTNLFSTGEDQN